MTELFVRLPNAERIQQFVAAISDLPGNFDLSSGGRILDARSLMGIFSFDLSKPIKLKVYHDSRENIKAIEPFVAEVESTDG